MNQSAIENDKSDSDEEYYLDEAQQKEEQELDDCDRMEIRHEMDKEGVWNVYETRSVEENRRLQAKREWRKKQDKLFFKYHKAVLYEMTDEGPWYDYFKFEAELFRRVALKIKQEEKQTDP